MRIVIVGTAFPMRGGIAHYVALLYQKLIQRGHDVHVLSFKRQYPKLLFPGKTQQDDGKELISIPSNPILDSIGPISWIRAFFWLKKLNPDIVLFKYWMPFFAPCYAAVAWLAKKFLQTQIIYVCDNIIPHENNFINRPLNRLGLKYADWFIVQSKSVEQDLLSIRKEAQYTNVPHPVYEIFPPAVPKQEARSALKIFEEHILVYFGFIRPYKGVKYLVEAMPYILEQFPVRLLVCGEFYEGRQDTLDLIDKLQLKDHITVYDQFVPNEDVPLYFCAGDIIVLPYVTATQSGIVQIAYHYNKPVIVTDVGGLPEVVPHGITGYVVPPQDARAIAEAVCTFYNSGKADQFEKNIKNEKKKYSWDKMVDAIEEGYGSFGR